MRAIVKTAPEPGALEFREVETPVPQPGQALIKITGAGICGTDIAIWRWHEQIVGQYNAIFPLVPGHEMAGTVVESTTGELAPGTLVGVNPQIACGRCEYCAVGRSTLCVRRVFIGGGINGGWAEYAVVPEKNCFAVPEGCDPAVAPLMEPLAVAAHAVIERVPPVPGDLVAVIGCGPIGLLTLVLARNAGASNVVVTGTGADAARLELARELGGIPVNIDEADPVDVVRSLGWDGADIVYETSGNPAVPEQAISMARRGGRLALVGLASRPSELLMTPIVLRELELIGSRGYSESTWNALLRVLPAVHVDALKVVSHRMPLTDVETALELLTSSRSANKILLVP
ncbi:zinc-dependent alcohol dehydrogenase [Ruicaihuangia caeni]|uniref:Alcohol dehydrogenase catalytic domain-containing protein n=1 Tax=Ruicaihuangia caeni TaxID=3042517 RepID=A0AAW6T563_9MICO|nr:alcohol dehydrogenase catalytic domain-containing protein [Klugiella sp. YN-L-19]MDI2098887.1 alcohol dehydrogenase catalytic domain-containing protein [Klugiella sp. YN-L-19]